MNGWSLNEKMQDFVLDLDLVLELGATGSACAGDDSNIPHRHWQILWHSKCQS